MLNGTVSLQFPGQIVQQDVWIKSEMGRNPSEEYKVNAYLILQMKERLDPMHILIEDCWPSFFTVPVFKSRIRPKKAMESNWRSVYKFNSIY